jgi:hypothetical protein
MTFGALPAWQAWLLLAAAAAVAAWLFLIKLKPPRLLVPSLLLWQRVLDSTRETTLWERIRRVVSLVLTIVIALVLTLAVARPSVGRGAGTAARGRRLIVLDSSWSMLARTRSGERRWDRAEAEARRLAVAASGDEIALATTADGLIEGPTPDLALIESALDRIKPTGGEGAAWPRVGGVESVHFLTDGATARALDPGVVVHSVFEPASNVAITALEVRPSTTDADAGDAFLEVANFATSGQRVHVTLVRGSVSMFDRQIDMAAGEAMHQTIPLPRGGDPRLEARVEADGNALDVDDQASAWIDHAQPTSVVVVGANTGWLRPLLAREPDVRATFVAPAGYRPGREDAVIFDRWAPAEPPGRPALVFAPPASDWLGEPGPEERRPRWTSPGAHAVVRGLDPLTITIDRARPYSGTDLVPVALSDQKTPLVYVRESPIERVALVTFGPDESNLTAAPAFPVLVGDALDWLTHPASGGNRRPGPLFVDRGVTSVVGPKSVRVPLQEAGEGLVARLDAPGLYVLSGGGARSIVAVNVGDPQVSNLNRTTLATNQRAVTVEAGGAGRAWWVYCATIAFFLILAEWWTWQRRVTV